jgi:DNA topoisomerase-1
VQGSAAEARSAGLRYVSDEIPGYRRRRRGRGFSYVDAKGRTLPRDVCERIRRLAIPPAWTDVWIAADPRAHLLATGRDARGRKQYLYHPQWRSVRDSAKFDRMAAFGDALPRLRRRVDDDLRRHGLPRERVLAAAVRLLEASLIRVGNEEYARANGSYGLTTLRQRHVEVGPTRIHVAFRGKGGIRQSVDICDRRLARVIGSCQELPGQELFQYLDDDGATRSIGSADVNDYLHETMGEGFTAKDFRTWSGTVLAAVAMHELGDEAEGPPTRRHVNQVVEQVAARLGNTRTICRKCYIHPDVFACDQQLLRDVARAARSRRQRRSGLSPEESAVLRFLKRQAREAARARRPLRERLAASL